VDQLAVFGEHVRQDADHFDVGAERGVLILASEGGGCQKGVEKISALHLFSFSADGKSAQARPEPSVQARVSAARRNLKKADDEIADSTYRNRI
jgi:hypothetical protein